MWQGPAPRSECKDNIHPYNWHWLRRFGTGEALNNGTHETDVCRWALGVGYPETVNAQAGRYQFKDDWEFYDTLVATLKYPDKMIGWDGKSDQGMKYIGRDLGALIRGTKESVILVHDGYEVYDWKGNKTDELKLGKIAASSDLLSQDEIYQRALREPDQRHQDRRKASLPHCGHQYFNHLPPTGEYVLDGESRVADRYHFRPCDKRSCCDEAMGSGLRKRMGADGLAVAGSRNQNDASSDNARARFPLRVARFFGARAVVPRTTSHVSSRQRTSPRLPLLSPPISRSAAMRPVSSQRAETLVSAG